MGTVIYDPFTNLSGLVRNDRNHEMRSRLRLLWDDVLLYGLFFAAGRRIDGFEWDGASWALEPHSMHGVCYGKDRTVFGLVHVYVVYSQET